MVNELKKQFDEEKAKWKQNSLFRKQNKELKYIKRVNHVTGEIIKTNNKRVFDEIDNNSEVLQNLKKKKERVRRGVSLVEQMVGKCQKEKDNSLGLAVES